LTAPAARDLKCDHLCDYLLGALAGCISAAGRAELLTKAQP
jgi:hypothetical protein